MPHANDADQPETIWLNARLATLAPGRPGLGVVELGAVVARDGRIAFAGPQDELPARWRKTARATIDCEGRWITPALIDCHTHLVYGGDRAQEFELRLQGASYEEIARAGGGILSTVRATRAASEDELLRTAQRRLDALIAEGVGAVEVKSGYGLDLASERKSLRVARRLAKERNLAIRTTFLGAHALPPEFAAKRAAYVACVADEMIPTLAREGLIDAVDGFCERIAFTPDEIRRVFAAARQAGLPVKLHADQLSNMGGAALAAEFGALSADHLEYADEAGVAAMAKAGVVAGLLPGAYYVLRERQAPPVDLMRKHGVAMAVATDSNPGTSPMTSLLLALNMAATLFGLTVDECLAGATRNAARALGLADETGTLEAGKWADLAIWDIDRPAELVYRLGFNPLHRRAWRGTMIVALRAGRALLADWRAIWQGAKVSVDPSHGAAVAASAAAVERILARGEPVYGINTGFGKLAGVRIEAADLARLQRNIVLSHAAGVGDPATVATTRLMMALKLASLAQGASGVQPATLALIEAMLDRGVTPIVPSQGSVGASGDLAPLAHMAAAMIGVGDAQIGDRVAPAADALAEAGLAPVALQPKEGLALLNGTQFSTANALIGLFEAETLFRSVLATGALSTDGARGSDTPFDPRIHLLRRHRGQIEVAAALRALLAGSAIRASHLTGDERVQDPYCLRCQPQVMGACLDLLRQAAATLADEANAVSDNPLIFADSDEALSGGNFHAEPVAFAADIIALAICEIGSLAERRIALLVDPALSGLPAFLTPKPGLNSGFMIAQVTAAALVAENKQRATPASVDSIPTSANQEDHVSMAAHGARRLAPMAGNALAIAGIELLAAAQACDFHAPLPSSGPLEAVRARLRREVPRLEDDRYFHPDIEAATRLVRSGAIIEAAGEALLPGLERGEG